MIRIRSTKTVRCSLCGAEIDKLKAKEVFTGRMHYICLACDREGQQQVNAKIKDWRSSPRGKAIIEQAQKHK